MFLYYGSHHQCEWWNFHVGNSTKNINKKYPYLRNIYHHFFCIDLLQENITLTNLTGSFSISKMDGSFTIAGIDGKPLIKRGHFKVMTSAGEFTSLCGNVKCEILQKAEREILISYKDYNSSYMDFNLHVSCLEDCFSFTLGARRVNSSNREEYVYKLFPFIGDWDGKFSGSLSLLRFAYCGAHTGSNLSTSGLVPLNDESYKDSWWSAAVFRPSYLEGVVFGYKDFFRYTGRILANSMNVVCEVPVDMHDNFIDSSSLFIFPTLNVNKTLQKYSEMVSNTMRYRTSTPEPIGWGTWAWYQDQINEKIVLENAESLKALSNGVGNYEAIEIDHGWEERITLHRPLSSWVPRGQFCGNMPRLIEELHNLRFKVGIWVCPFVANIGDPVIEEHPEFLVKDADGRPFQIGGNGKGFCLDPTHPGAREYIGGIFRRLLEWGIDYFKLDFLRCLLSPDPYDQKDALHVNRFYFNGSNRVEAYRMGLELIRNTVGEEVFLLGSGAPFGPSIGFLDGMRIGQDISSDWDDGTTGIRDCARNMIAMSTWNRKYWINDSDYLVPSSDIEVMRYWASLIAVSGGMVTLSCVVSELQPWQKRIVSSIIPPLRQTSKLCEWNTEKTPFVLGFEVVSKYDTWHIVGCFNPMDCDLNYLLTSQKIGINPYIEWTVWGFWRENFVGLLEKDGLVVPLKPRSSEIFSLKQCHAHPTLISTNMHFSQGAVEISDVIWDDKRNSLCVNLSNQYVKREGSLFFQVTRKYKLRSVVGGHKNHNGSEWVEIKREKLFRREIILDFSIGTNDE